MNQTRVSSLGSRGVGCGRQGTGQSSLFCASLRAHGEKLCWSPAASQRGGQEEGRCAGLGWAGLSWAGLGFGARVPKHKVTAPTTMGDRALLNAAHRGPCSPCRLEPVPFSSGLSSPKGRFLLSGWKRWSCTRTCRPTTGPGFPVWSLMDPGM